MRKVLLFTLSIASLSAFFAQAPTVLGTYLPVVNTEIKQVWIHPGVNNGPAVSTIPIPQYGNSVFWDYSSLPLSIETGSNKNTHTLKTVPTNTSPGNLNGANYPEATHASHWTSPISTFDTVWTYSKVDTSGMYTVGVVNLSSGIPIHIDYQSLDFTTGQELIIPNKVELGIIKEDSVLRETVLPFTPTGFPNVPQSSDPLTVHQYSFKKMEVMGWGSIKTPIDSLGGVLLARETDHEITYYINNTSDTIHAATYDREYYKHFFLRNNTFATSLLMQLNTDTALTSVGYAWYTLPSDVGTIEGTVYEDTVNNAGVVAGAEVYLFREHGNFTRDDILATTETNSNGVYILEDIPYGMYRVAARMMTSQGVYTPAHSYLTYFEDTTSAVDSVNPALGVDWTQCDLITSTGATTVGKDIYLRHDTLALAQSGAVPSLLSGTLTGFNLNKQGGDDPIPGIDIIVKKNPGSQPIISTQTDVNGEFSFENLPNGDYKIWVDMPGVDMDSTYTFNVEKGVFNRCEFDFKSDLDTINRTGQNVNTCLTIVTENKKELNNISIFPNPYESSSVVAIALEEQSTVSIKVFDVTGKLIQTLIEGIELIGDQSFEINPISDAGIYFVKINIGEKGVTRRLIKL